MLTQDNYADKLAVLQAAKAMPMINWKASHVLAWLEIDVYMPIYGKLCAENIKSGKVGHCFMKKYIFSNFFLNLIKKYFFYKFENLNYITG